LLETAVRQSLEYEINIFFIMETSIEGCEIEVIQVGLYLNLSQDVLLYLPILDSLFGHLFYYTNHSDRLLLSHEDIAEGSFS
jgi:hypothetical protein